MWEKGVHNNFPWNRKEKKNVFIKNVKKRKLLRLGVSMGRSGSGLCPTHDRLDDIGFPTRRLATNCKNPRVKSDRTWLVNSQVGRSWKYVAGGSNQWQLHVFLARSSLDLSKTTKFEQNNTISLPKLRKTHQILAKNYQIFVGFEKNWPDLCRNWTKPSKS